MVLLKIAKSHTTKVTGTVVSPTREMAGMPNMRSQPPSTLGALSAHQSPDSYARPARDQDP